MKEFNLDLFMNLLLIGSIVGVITMALIQKTKALLPTSKSWVITVYSFVINTAVGVLCTLTFTKYKIDLSLWVGLFAFLGADTIYKSLESLGLLKQLKSLKPEEVVLEPIVKEPQG